MQLEHELLEKKQIIQAMTQEIESYQKKSDKSKISLFMKKLKKGASSRENKT